MNLFELLPDEDIYQMREYMNEFGGGALPKENMDYFLRFWKDEKSSFYKAFGKEFIIRKEVSFTKTNNALAREMENMLFADCFRNHFRATIEDLAVEFKDNWLLILKTFVTDWNMLANNIYTGEPVTIPAEATVNGRALQVNRNCKMVKMLGKIAAALGIYDDGYEKFRQLHSQVLNQKVVHGNLCLSIHPMDFITLSDNNCNWSSCMSWKDEAGEYRLGTIEMMNSPYVIVAYLESSEPMKYHIGEEEFIWNNKRWRQLYVVTKEFIIGNRQYPFVNKELECLTLNWVKEIATSMYGFYCDDVLEIENNRTNFYGERSVYFELTMNYMYNDIYGKRSIILSPRLFDTIGGLRGNYRLNLSGPAVCVKCGNTIGYDTVDPMNVQCTSCIGYFYCNHCGEWSYGEEYIVDGRSCCEWCYYNDIESCDCCDERSEEMNHVYIQIFDQDEEDPSFDNWAYCVNLCDFCYSNPKSYERHYGKMYDVVDGFGIARKAFNLKNCSDDGLLYGSIDHFTGNNLIKIRDAVTAEDRDYLIKLYHI